ncbi:MAG TPA: glycosyltransferase family 4 protein [Ktedonobacterales bacterium]|nr:glycosyltransferase family 4 protein [Ktedonobacterales bacterium]
MKILVVAHSLPRPTWGAGTRNYHLLRALGRDHDVSLLALIRPDERGQSADYLRPHTRMVRQVDVPPTGPKRTQQVIALAKGQSYLMALQILPAAQAALDEELSRHAYDAVLFEGLLVAGYRVPRQMRVILDEHNIEHELMWRSYQSGRGLMRRGFNWIEYRRIRPVEISRCERADLVMVTSERERLLLHSLLPEKNVQVVPNGVDTQSFFPDTTVEEIPGRIVFTASFDYYPNVQGALHFAEHIWPLVQRAAPNATWSLVGRNPPPDIARLGNLPGVMVSGSVPAVQPHLAAAQVAIVPLLAGAGTRLKILEALAMRRAVVSTALGCEGIDSIPGKHLVVADEPERFAESIVELFNDPARRATLGEEGRTLVEKHYSWDYCGSQLLAALARAQQTGWSVR